MSHQGGTLGIETLAPGRNDAPRYRLAPHVCHCVTAEGTVLLDLKRNRYSGLAPRAGHSLARLIDGAPGDVHAVDEPPDTWAQALVRAGLLLPAAARTSAVSTWQARLEEACEAVISTSCSRALRPHDVLTFTRAYVGTRAALRRESLYDIATELQAQRRASAPCPQSSAQIAERVAHFRQLRPWAFPSKDQCLLHALTLNKFLLLHGLHASWVIGVMMQPWAAHSWVQYGSSVLDGTPEQVRPYHPILVV